MIPTMSRYAYAPSEIQIIKEMAAEGKTNREIAERLMRTKEGVDKQVRRILGSKIRARLPKPVSKPEPEPEPKPKPKPTMVIPAMPPPMIKAYWPDGWTIRQPTENQLRAGKYIPRREENT